MPPRGLGAPHNVRIGSNSYGHPSFSEQIRDLDAAEPELPDFGEPIEVLRATVAKRVGKVPFPVVATRMHPEIKKLIDIDEQRRRKRERSAYPQFEKEIRFDGTAGKRRLRLLNALFLALSRNGATVTLGRGIEEDWGFSLECSRVVHFDLDCASRLKATRENRLVKLAKDGLHDPLIVRLRSTSRTWSDNESPLDKALAEIITEFIVEVESGYRDAIVQEHQGVLARRAEERAQRAKWRFAEERLSRERRAKLERERIGRLIEDARAMREANDLRSYVAAVQARPELGGVAGPGIEAWSRWALKQAEKLDPVLNGRLQASIEESGKDP